MSDTPKMHNEQEKLGPHCEPETLHHLEPDKVIYADGTVSDAELYDLDNPEANAVADAAAMHIAVELGFTPEEALKMCGGKATSDSRRPKKS